MRRDIIDQSECDETCASDTFHVFMQRGDSLTDGRHFSKTSNTPPLHHTKHHLTRSYESGGGGQCVCVQLLLTHIVEDKPHQGHWTCMIREGKAYSYFDFYGKPVDGELKYVPKSALQALNESSYPLSRLLQTLEPGEKLIQSKVGFQKYSPKINTCGRHVCNRILFSLEGLNQKQFEAQMKKWK